MTLLHIVILAIIQGMAELLPVSSSAHVVVSEKLMGLDPTSPQMTLLLVMLHTGTMFAVIVYFWKQWSKTYFQSLEAFKRIVLLLFAATACTGMIGEGLIKSIEKFAFHGAQHAEVEQLFGRLDLIAIALAAVGVLIVIAGIYEKRHPFGGSSETGGLEMKQSVLIGIVQGFCLHFRGFSRSGATISAGLLAGVEKSRGEAFSFALAVALTPAADGREVLRLMKADRISGGLNLASALAPSLVGMVCAFAAGLLALKWLSKWLESDRWYLFGIYCLAAAVVVGYLYHIGY
ncbi:MAG: undecaprenyl-diphosphate phosphatase [Candidatus Acidiferrales bacterium]